MNCERIQELILTDYLDGEIENDLRKELEAHLADCPRCLDFAKAARSTAFECFEGASKAVPPGHLWSSIEEKIQEENAPSVIEAPSWLERFRGLFVLPKPALVLAAVLMLFVAASTLDQVKPRPQGLSQSSVEYITALVESAVDVSVYDDFGTDVEQVFL